MAAKRDSKGHFLKGTAPGPGRPKKNYKQHIEDVIRMGYRRPSRDEYFEMMGLLMAMDERDIKAFGKDKDRPYWVRLIITDLQNKHVRQKLMADYRDWMYGKAKIQVDHTSAGERMAPPVLLVPTDDDE